MSLSKWNLHNLISRILAGAAFGCGLLVVVEFILIPHPLYKGDSRWETVFFIAEIGLPGAFIAGAVVGLLWKRHCLFQLTLLELVVWCAIVALCSALLGPTVERIRTGTRQPMYEVVPATMFTIFGFMALAGIVVLISMHAYRQISKYQQRRIQHK